MNGIAERTTNTPDPKAVAELHAYVRRIIARERTIRQTRERMRETRQESIAILEDPWLPDFEALRRVRELIDEG